jgi:hypothetical protein
MMMVIGGPKGGDGDKPSYGKKEEDSEEGGESKLSGMGRKRAAEDILRAIEDGDASALDKALYSHKMACSGAEEE